MFNQEANTESTKQENEVEKFDKLTPLQKRNFINSLDLREEKSLDFIEDLAKRSKGNETRKKCIAILYEKDYGWILSDRIENDPCKEIQEMCLRLLTY